MLIFWPKGSIPRLQIFPRWGECSNCASAQIRELQVF